MRLTVVAVLVMWLVGCGPNPKAPVKVMAIVPSIQGNYETRAVDLKTVTSITSLKGSILEMVGGNRVVLDGEDPLQQLNGGIQNMTDDQRYEVLVRDKGQDVRGNYIERAQVLWPADFHTWNMVTTYYNFEQGYTYYQNVLATDPPELQKLRVMYWPEVHLNTADPITDNALYLSFIKSFVIVPAKLEQRIPMAMNLGVIGHEMAHRVFNHRVLNDAGIHAAIASWNAGPFNLLKSMDEGLADFHGYGVTCLDVAGCRPGFLASSVSNTTESGARDLSRDACLDSSLKSAFQNFSPDQWTRGTEIYRYGTLWAVALYQAGNKAGKMGVLQRSLLAAYDDTTVGKSGLNQLINGNLSTPQNFTAEAAANAIVAHVDDADLKKYLCNELTDRLQLSCTAFPCAEMPACPSTASRTNHCPVVP